MPDSGSLIGYDSVTNTCNSYVELNGDTAMLRTIKTAGNLKWLLDINIV